MEYSIEDFPYPTKDKGGDKSEAQKRTSIARAALYNVAVMGMEVMTKLIMDKRGCNYDEATGLGINGGPPTETIYARRWNEFMGDQKVTKAKESDTTKSKVHARKGIKKKGGDDTKKGQSKR